MTLSTNIYVLDATDPHELFRFCQGLLAKYDEAGREPSEHICADEPARHWSTDELTGAWTIANQLGQNLPAILDIDYRPDGPLRTPEQASAHDEDCDDDCSGDYHERACWLDIDFDTAYSTRFPNGWGCGDLHAWLVGEVGRYLDERSVRWEWRNEFTSDVHGGPDRYVRLAELGTGGAEATQWFLRTALPAIMAHNSTGDGWRS